MDNRELHAVVVTWHLAHSVNENEVNFLSDIGEKRSGNVMGSCLHNFRRSEGR